MKPGTAGRAAPIIWLDSVDSTNTALKKLAREGAAHGTVLAARRQTSGRGRLGRGFVSPEGGLYMSILWRPDMPPEQAAKLGCAGALAMCAAVERCCGLSPDIKWPNDLLLGGKKLCGILAEAAWTSEGSGFLVLGMGLNVNIDSFPPELADRATSLYLSTGRRFDINELLVAIVTELDRVYAAWGSAGSAFIGEYRRRCVTPGRDILIDHEGRREKVHALSISDGYSLSIRWPDGRTEEKSFGEIFNVQKSH